MFSADDTIVAIATPLGRGGLGVVRLSGPLAASIGQRLIGRDRPFEARRATFARLAGTPSTSGANASADHATVRDEVVLTHFPAPHSYTGEDVVEVSAHGSPVVLQSIVQAAMAAGARLAEPGEFTLRAFLNGRIDLIQAEAVADLIDAVTPLQARAAFDQLEGTLTRRIGGIEAGLFDLIARLEASLDFPDEGYHFVARERASAELAALREQVRTLLAQAGQGRMVREGAQVVIVGTPNVGKSSLFNALLNAERAIVTPIAGTTRDLLTERADLRGVSVSLVDTAGIREALDVVEHEGVTRAQRAAGIADVTVVVLDRSRPLTEDDHRLLTASEGSVRVIVVNKVDLPAAWETSFAGNDVTEISVKTGRGIGALAERLAATLIGTDALRDPPLVTNVRHIALLEHADAALARAAGALDGPASVSEEWVLADLQDAAGALQEVTGRRTTDDLLAEIFSRFCIGK